MDKLFHLELDVLTAVYALSGKALHTFPEKVRSKLTAPRVEFVKRNGIESVKRLSLKPGLYQIRVGVREPAGERIGTSSVLVEVPDLTRGKLTLSSIFLREDLNQPDSATAAAADPPRASSRQGVRIYRQGDFLVYQMRVYGGADGAPKQQQENEGANLSLRLELKQGERTIYPGEWQPLAPLVVKRDTKGLEVGGQLKLTLPAGIYELGLSVQDAKRKKTVRGSVPFAVETSAPPENSLRRGGS